MVRALLLLSACAFCTPILADSLTVNSMVKHADCAELETNYTLINRTLVISFPNPYEVSTVNATVKKVCILEFDITDTGNTDSNRHFVYLGKAVTSEILTGKVGSSLRFLGDANPVDIFRIYPNSEQNFGITVDSGDYTTQENSVLEFRIDLTVQPISLLSEESSPSFIAIDSVILKL